MAGPTEGPWTASCMVMDRHAWAALNSGRHPIRIVQRGQDVIAVVWSDDDSDDEANAHIIAASLDMLAALRQAETWLMGWASAEKELAAIRAAIAKAEGRANG